MLTVHFLFQTLALILSNLLDCGQVSMVVGKLFMSERINLLYSLLTWYARLDLLCYYISLPLFVLLGFFSGYFPVPYRLCGLNLSSALTYVLINKMDDQHASMSGGFTL